MFTFSYLISQATVDGIQIVRDRTWSKIVQFIQQGQGTIFFHLLLAIYSYFTSIFFSFGWGGRSNCKLGRFIYQYCTIKHVKHNNLDEILNQTRNVLLPSSAIYLQHFTCDKSWIMNCQYNSDYAGVCVSKLFSSRAQRNTWKNHKIRCWMALNLQNTKSSRIHGKEKVAVKKVIAIQWNIQPYTGTPLNYNFK